MSETMPTDRKRATLYVALIFLCGALTGFAATNLWKNWWPGSTSANAGKSRSVQHRVEKFTRELDLTPEQARQLNDILDETHANYRRLEREQEGIRQQGRARIRSMLTEEQKPKYEQLLARQEANRRRQRR
ncbi:MAG: Spy/CpxP family protein refolding chaperone [Acidobacteria bacterium]|nr:Spy/CpxP family protein refolding chaperone [Acidobacteriota bacterium]